MASILLVDDERSMRDYLEILLRKRGHEVFVAQSGEEALTKLTERSYDLVLTDLRLGTISGMRVLEQVRAIAPLTQVIVMTAYATMETAIEALNAGAYHYLVKPFQNDEVVVVLQKALEQQRIVRENLQLRTEISELQRSRGQDLIGKSAALDQVFQLIRRVAPTKTSVLVTGETGTGKELVAKSLHAMSPRKDGAFVVVNCGAIPENLLESELFGHKKGAFTGAIAHREGLFELANNGTIFLDEVGELPLSMQVKLLRVLQEKSFKRVGGNETITVDARIVAATNRSLEDEVRGGTFREDLYYRLNVVQIRLPPLRERQDDIPLLVQHFLRKFGAESGRSSLAFSPAAMDALLRYGFPGNVRELENIVERAVALEPSNLVMPESLPPAVREGTLPQAYARTVQLPTSGVDLEKVLGEMEQRLLEQALERSRGVKVEAAKLLGITFRSIRYRLRKHGLVKDDKDDLPEDE